ncbi:MAG: beta-ketoacyl synthase N-terminal-like domain-containing protein [Cyanobacteriota bacterium]
MPKPVGQYHIVLAGGIADPASCATARILSTKAKAVGIRTGILTGTPYLYTDEAVSTGAIVESYRETVIAASSTVNLETGAGHASRCAVTPFAHEFQQLKETYINEGLSGYQLREELEKLTLGRLRLATKGIKRDATGLVSVSEDESFRDGMYMLGQSAALLGQKTTISELHQRLTLRTREYLSALAEQPLFDEQQRSVIAGQVAIVAMDCMMPDSCDLNRFWEILISGEAVVKEVPPERWDPALYYSPDKAERDCVYSKWGGFLPPISVDSGKLGIPPVSLKKIEPLQILTLELITRLFEQHSINFDQDIRDRTAVFLGAGGGIGDMGGKYAARSEIERISCAEKSEIYSRLPEWGDETFPGLLFNVVAGRVANRLNLKGASYTVDAACASSLAAIYSAYRELTSWSCDLAIAGGVDTGQSPFAFLCFSRSQALSPTGSSKSFDQNADGIAISEGLGVVVMKRLSDALRDGDEVIAVIEGVGAASDGRGSSLTSPQSNGQQLAVERAWHAAGCSPSCMSLYEAHGTGTVAGDRTELETLLAITDRHSAAPQSCAVSSTKPNIGHTKSSAGIAGLMHAALCLHHRVLSPQVGASAPLEPLKNPSSPIFLNQSPSFWPTTEHGRKAGVSAFGFGGTNYHIVLSESPAPSRYSRSWPKISHYLFIWHSRDFADLKSQLTTSLHDISSHPEFAIYKISQLHWCQTECRYDSRHSAFRAAIVAGSRDQLLSRIQLLLNQEVPNESSVTCVDAGTYISHVSLTAVQLPVVLLFAGQGGLREDCLDELLTCNDAVKNSLDLAVAAGAIQSQFLRDLLLTRSSNVAGRLDFGSIPMIELQPLICAVQLGLADALVSCGLEPDLLIGHSLGELTATALAGMWSDRSTFLQLIRQRGDCMDAACSTGCSGMLATTLTDTTRLAMLLQAYTNTYVSNFNSPSQITISGPDPELERLVGDIKAIGEKATRLKVSGGFHSPLMDPAREAFSALISSARLRSPALTVLSLVDGCAYDSEYASSVSRLTRHMTASVDMVKGMASLDASPHLFINIGPSLTMDKLVQQNREVLGDIFVSLDTGSNDIDGYLNALSHLFCLLPDFRPNLGRRLPPLLRHPSPFETPTPAATVSNGMAYMLHDVPYPSARPPLTAATMPAPVQSLAGSGTAPDPTMTAAQIPLQPSTVDTIGLRSGATISSLPTLTSSPMSPLDASTSLQIYSIFSENVRQMLASQERVAIAMVSQSPVVPFSGSIPLPPVTATTLSPSAPAAPSTVDQTFAGFSFGFPDAALQSPAPFASQTLASPAQPVVKAEQIPAIAPPAQPPSAPALQAVAVHAAQESSAPDFAELLIEITSDLTGYPTDMLEPSLALEADLGIDSIKRVEIFARLQKAVSSQLRDEIKARTDDLAAAPKIGDIIEILSSLTASSGK